MSVRDDTGLVVDYRIEGECPQFGNDDDRVDHIAADTRHALHAEDPQASDLSERDCIPNSVLTITSNVVYGKHTGNTPDGRRKGEPFAPGANPMHGRDHRGMAGILPVGRKVALQRDAAGRHQLHGLGRADSWRGRRGSASTNAVKAFDVYFGHGGFHMNVNVLDREMLEDAMEHPDNYPQLTIRVSGYAVNFVRLTSRAAARRDQPHLPRRAVSTVALPSATPSAGCLIPLDGSSGWVHSWDLSTGVDGPGTRLVVFLSGCALRCLYCQNPETWNRRQGGTETPLEDIGRLIVRYRPFIDAAGGGFTVSGGEPLQQAPFTRRMFEHAQAEGLHTALDTSGFLGRHADDALLDATSLVLLDIKAGTDAMHRRR